MEPRKPIDSPPLIPQSGGTIAPTTAPAPADGKGHRIRPPVLSLIVTGGAAAALAAVVTGLALVGVRADRVGETAAHPLPTLEPSRTVVEAGPAPTWTGARRARWAPDGSKTITFTLEAVHELSAWMTRARPVLAVRCLSRATDVFVVLDTPLAFDREADRRTVRVQWDDGPVSTQQWDISETARELFVPDGVGFVRRMAGARRLRFGFTPFNAPPVTAEFVVEGFDRLADLVANTCGWRLAEPSARG